MSLCYSLVMSHPVRPVERITTWTFAFMKHLDLIVQLQATHTLRRLSSFATIGATFTSSFAARR